MKHALLDRRGMTLIELLTVVLIIGLLVGMLIPVFAKARQAAKKSRARSEAIDLAKAWEGYWVAYSNWPSGSEFDMTANRVQLLQGDNPLDIKFMEFYQEARDDGFRDPWGRHYKVRLWGGEVQNTVMYRIRTHMPMAERNQ